LTDLRTTSISSLLDLSLALLSERDSKHTEDVSVSGLDINVSLNESLPFTDHGAELISSEIHSIEVSEAVAALDIFDTKSDVTVSISFVVLEVSEGASEDASLEAIRGNFSSLGAGNEGLSNVTGVEYAGGFDVIPIFLGEGISAAIKEIK
jgi:hypothetical protein